MALPLKTGADLYNQQLIRARLQNLGAQPNTADVGLGQVYFNTGTNTAASLRIGYCYETGSVPKFHHVANLEDINRLDELISALSGSSSESVASVLGRVITLEGYFSNGKAKDADLLDGHNSDYFATATTVNDLLDDYEAFKAVFSDNSDDYINTWAEVKAFLDGIKNTEDLNAILLGINTELGKKADKATTLAGYGIKDGMKVMPWIASEGVDFNNLTTVGSYGIASHNAHNGPIWYGTLLTMGGDYNYYRSQLAVYENGQMYVRAKNGNDIWSDWRTILDNYNYASELDKRYLQLTGGIISNTSNAPLKIKTDSESAWVGIEYLNNLGEREGSIGVYGGKPIFVPAALDKIWTILHTGNYSDLITTLNGNLSVGGNISLQNTGQLRYDNKEVIQYIASNNSLYIGYGTAGSSEAWNTSVWGNNIKLINKSGTTLLHAKDSNDVTIGYLDALSILSNQDVHIKGNLIVDGEVSSGGIGGEGSGSGASGIVILEDWEKYDDTLAQVLGAGLGVGLRDKIAALESKATNVSVAQTLTSGKEIGAITIDGVATKLFAPNDYISTSGGTLTGDLYFQDSFIRLDMGKTGRSRISNIYGDEEVNALAFTLTGLYLKSPSLVYVDTTGTNYDLLHAGNYSNYALPLSGGTISGALSIQSSDDGKLIFDNTDTETYWSLIYFKQNGETYGRFGTQGTTDLSWNSNLILHSGNYESIVGNKFLKLSGGELTGSSSYILTINRTTGKPLINYRFNGTSLGFLGIDTDSSPCYVDPVKYETNTLLHAGNFNSYAPKLDGTGATGRWSIGLGAEELTDLNDARHGFLFTTTANYGTTDGNKPHKSHAAGLTWAIAGNSNYRAQLASASDDGNLFFRMMSYGTWNDWKTLAFTDSNVASATKLQTARTIWGQSFDGTGNVSGNLKINQGDFIQAVLNGTPYSILGVNSGGSLTIGQGTGPAMLGTTIYGYGISMCYGTTGAIGFRLNSSGNVTIGSDDLASTNHRLYISGGLTRINSGLQVKGHTSFFAESNDAYVTSFYTNEGGLTIQPRIEDVGYTDIFLNPSGGNVGIGTTSSVYKLNVNGSIGLAGQIISQYEGTDAWRIVATSSTQAYIQGGVGGNIAITGMNATELGEISLYAKTVAPQYGNSTVLGAYNRRWLNVISEMGNFSSRLLVGGASDDGTNALQVHGDIALRRGVSSAIGAPYDTNNPTIYNRIIFDGATYGIRYYSGGWTSSVVDSHTFYVGLNNDAALIIKNNKDVHISGNLIVDGQVSSGGVAEEGTGGVVGGSGLERVPFTIPANTTSFTCEHNLGTREISVSIYEDGNDFQQVLADVYLDSTNVARIVFGSATDVVHKVVIIG